MFQKQVVFVGLAAEGGKAKHNSIFLKSVFLDLGTPGPPKSPLAKQNTSGSLLNMCEVTQIDQGTPAESNRPADLIGFKIVFNKA